MCPLPLCAAEGGTASQLRHYLVLVNPISGKGQAEPTFRKHVEPLFDIADITCDVVVTSRLRGLHDGLHKTVQWLTVLY